MALSDHKVLLRRVALWSLPALVLIVALVLLFRPAAELVDIAEVKLKPMRVTIDEEGEARTRDIFTISAPVRGRLLRTSLEAGDPVVANHTVVAQIEPSDPEFLDPRTQAELEAVRDGAMAARDLAQAELKQAQAERNFAEAEVVRVRELYAKGTVPRQRVDDAERAAQATQAAVDAAEANLRVADFGLHRAEAALITPVDTTGNRLPCECVTVKSPVDGRVLRVLQESEVTVAPGTPLLEVGDAHDLEVVADMLSVDAVKIRPGHRAVIEGWGGEQALQAVVRVVEPFAFTKVSALGIEEQRVNVVLDFTGPETQRAQLGHGYRVEVKVIMWDSDEVVTVPLTSLFRDNERWAVYLDSGGEVVLRGVEIGHTAGLDVEVVGGLAVGDRVVRHPNERLSDGARIRYR